MATANIITHIHSVLEDVEFLVPAEVDTWSLDKQILRRLRFRLRSLKRFVLICARILGNDASLRSIFVRIQDTVCRVTEEIHFQLNGQPADSHINMIYYFEGSMMCLDEEIDEWYRARRSSISCTKYEFIDYILEALVDIRGTNADSPYLIKNLVETIEALEEQMLFMKRLISLATKKGGADLLAHAESVAIKAAYLLYTFLNWEDCASNLSMLLKIAMPIDSKVCQAYTKALSSSKVQMGRRRQKRFHASTQHKDDAFIAMKDLLDSLVSHLWELLRLGLYKVSMEDMQELYGGLRSLRTILKHHLACNLSMAIKQEIGDAICDAGVFICSFHQTHTEAYSALLNMCEVIDIIRAEIGFEEPQVLMSNFPGHEDDRFSTASNNRESEMKILHAEEAGKITNEVIGLHEEEVQIVDQLERGSRQLRIVAIVGMAGLGKTTLAAKVYTNPSVTLNFHTRAWCPISQVATKRKCC